MNLTRPNLIAKEEKTVRAKGKDISYSGIGCYTDTILYSGMKMNIKINDVVCAGQVVHVSHEIFRNTTRYLVGMMFCGKPGSQQPEIKQYVDQLNSTETPNEAQNENDKRRHERKLFDKTIQITLSETCANITENNFQISKNGFTCCVDQYIPLFREIEIKIKSPDIKENFIEGIVVKCDKMDGYYDLAVFCPQCNLDKLTN